MKTKKLTFKIGKILLVGGIMATSLGCEENISVNPVSVNPAPVADTSVKDTSVMKDMGDTSTDTEQDVISNDSDANIDADSSD